MSDSNMETIIARIRKMEAIYDQARTRMEEPVDEAALRAYQGEIGELAAYYASPVWKEDLERDEKGELPKDLKRGVLSEDGIYDLLERNKELLESFGAEEIETERLLLRELSLVSSISTLWHQLLRFSTQLTHSSFQTNSQ